jgi:hypothetical protein
MREADDPQTWQSKARVLPLKNTINLINRARQTHLDLEA